MKTETEIRINLSDVQESGLNLDGYMSGYVAALNWVLNPTSNTEEKKKEPLSANQNRAQEIWCKIKPLLSITNDTTPAEQDNLKFLAIIGFSDTENIIKVCGGGDKLLFYQLVNQLVDIIETKG